MKTKQKYKSRKRKKNNILINKNSEKEESDKNIEPNDANENKIINFDFSKEDIILFKDAFEKYTDNEDEDPSPYCKI